MSKKCDFCGNRIVVDQGDYVNYYPAVDESNHIAWKMESYHLKCFLDSIQYSFIQKSSGGGF